MKGQLEKPAHDALSGSELEIHSAGGLVRMHVEPAAGVTLTAKDEQAVLDALSQSAARQVSVRFDRATIGENEPPGAVVALRVEILEGIKMPAIGENDPPTDL